MANAITKARMDVMEKRGYGPVYDLLGQVLNAFDGDCSAALVWLAEKVVAEKEKCRELKPVKQTPMRRISSK